MKMGKRVLSIFLVVLMLATSIPFAVAEDGIQSSMNTSLNFISDNALGQVLSNAQSEEASNLYGIREVTLSGNSAETSFVAPDNTNLVVAIYEEETNRMLSSGLVAVDSQTEKATVALSAFTLPSYYIVKAFLLDENNAAICKNYENLEHTKIYQEFLEKDVYDFDARRVMNLDNATDNNFFVVSDQAKVITKSASQNIIRSYDSEEGVYVIQNADNNLKAAKSGDVIYIPDGQQEENYILTKVKTVSVTGSTVTLTEVEDCEIGDLFDYIKIDTEHNTRKNGAKTAPKKSGYADDDSGYDDATYKTGELELKKSYKGTGYEISLSGKIGAYITMKFYYDFHLFGKDYYEIENAVGVKATAESSISVGASVNDLHPLEVVRTGIPVFTGVTAEVAAYIGIKISGSIEAKGTLVFSVEKGFRSTSESGSQQIPFEPKLKTEFELAANVTIDIIPTLELSLKILHVFGVSISVSADFEISFTVPALSISSDDSLIYPEDKHACGIKCVEGELKLIISGKIKADFGLHEKHRKTILTLSLFSFETKIGDFYFSFADGRREFGLGKCPYHMYLATFELKVENSTSTDGIVLKVNGTPLTQKDNKGRYFCYLSAGRHLFTYEAPGYKYAMFGTFDPSFTIFDHGYNTILILRKEDGGDDPDNPDNPDDPDGPGSSDGIGSNDDLSNLGTQGGIIKFGAYPQTEVTDSATIAALNSRASDWQSYGYYSGTGSMDDGQMTAKDYMQYCDVKYGGNKYRGVTFSQYRPFYTGYTSSSNNQQINGYLAGTTYWFQYEPLQWKVIDPSDGLLLCVSVIDSQPYNNYHLISGIDSYGGIAHWGDAGKTYYASDYENSSLRHWLLHDFFSTAFTEAQQNHIRVNQHQNNDGWNTLSGNTKYTDYDSNPTDDKIFLLSYDEVLNVSYGFSSSRSTYDTARQAKGTNYAKCQGLFVYNGDSSWWLRSPGWGCSCVCSVSDSGFVNYGSGVISTTVGVRPACKLKVSSLNQTPAQAQKNTSAVSTKAFQSNPNDIGSVDDLTNLSTKGATVQFGAYPQSRVTDSSTITALNSHASEWKSYGYYIGTGSRNEFYGDTTASDYMQYCDVNYGGSKYRGVKFSQYRPLNTCIASLENHSHQYENGYTINTTYWFKYEPLKWRVLDPSAGLVICTTIIDSQPYNNHVFSGGTDSFGHTAYWGNAEKTYYASNYANSSLRKWLTGDFFATAFTQSQQSKIAVNHNQNNDGYYTWDDYENHMDFDSDPTDDKLFLLSRGEVVNSNYGFSSYDSDDGVRQLKCSDYAKCQGLDVYRSTGSDFFGNADWWLRTAKTSEYACEVSVKGDVESVRTVSDTCRGICPAFKFDLSVLADPGEVDMIDYTYSGCRAGNDYILLNVTGYSSKFTLTTNNLEYIDQVTADERGSVSGSFAPRNVVEGSTTLLIGDFGSGVEVRKIAGADPTDPEPHTHSYTSTMTKQPTCSAPGVMTYTCACGDSYTKSIPATGEHMPAEAVRENETEATCSVNGSYDEVIYCAECGEELSRETVTIPATGEHEDADNDGYCDACEEMMQGGQHCKYCGKIHDGLFGWLVKFFHSILAIFKR